MLATRSATRSSAPDFIERWAQRIMGEEIPWFPSGIFPGEMAAFLGLCEFYQVETVIESGRRHGYSTQMLGEFTRWTPCEAFSIDLEEDAAIAADCRRRLSKYDGLELLVGDAFDILPDVARRATGRIALLIDGPKKHEANRLSATAAALFDVVLVAHHNAGPDTTWGREFAEWFPQARYYEEMGFEGASWFREFKAWEREVVGDAPLGDRSVDRSDMAIAPLSDDERGKRRLWSLDRRPSPRHPLFLALKWWARLA